ncbi:MAG TPA: lantibiotic dehydratase [Candidatus Dormibacteraeota bacterium]|nr:lantibiotic dehydratase [Candidatus Dormibacteraeota bacterium]
MTQTLTVDAPGAALPDHLAPLAGGRWAMWRWAALRSAGFPVDGVLALAAPACAAAADAYLESGGAQREAAFARKFEEAVEHGAAAARVAAADPMLREALAWQNRRALTNSVDFLLREPGKRTARHRKNEIVVARYLQRYCAKNDTIGFFGPVGWARVVDDGPLLAVEPGPQVLASRTAYFEGWCIDALGEALAADGSLLPWLAPRRMPYLRVERGALRPPLGPPIALSPAEAAALQTCDGERTARDVAALLLADPTLGLPDEEAVFAVLRKLRDARWIAWTLEVPAEGLHPERSLRRLLERVEDAGRRVTVLGALDELEAARDGVAASAGDAERVDRAMAALEETFVRLTSSAPTRRDGEAYSGRTLLYEDCRRDVEVRLGPQLGETLGPPLSLVLEGARWLSVEAAALCRTELRAVYDELARTAGPVVPFASFWFRAHPLIFDHGELLETLSERQWARWESVLTLPPGERRVAFDVDELRPRVTAAFDAPRVTWRSVRHHTPDVIITAPSAEDAAAGRYHYVLGEVHPMVNTLRPALFTAQHPAPDDLLAAVERDLPEPQMAAVFSRQQGGATLRISRGLVSPKDYRLVFAPDSCGVSVGRPLQLAALELEATDDSLEVRTRNGAVRFDILDVLNDILALSLVHSFEMLRPAEHTPRVSFGPLVVSRESWTLPREDLAFAGARSDRDRFLEARRWARAHDLPRFVFVRARAGQKPIFVDLESPLSINVLTRALGQPTSDEDLDHLVRVTEMLPTPDQLWLRDAEGRRYASEIRLVALER